jgi:hypothetical protein
LAAVAEDVRSAARSALAIFGDLRPVTVIVDDLDVTSLPGRTAF